MKNCTLRFCIRLRSMREIQLIFINSGAFDYTKSRCQLAYLELNALHIIIILESGHISFSAVEICPYQSVLYFKMFITFVIANCLCHKISFLPVIILDFESDKILSIYENTFFVITIWRKFGATQNL